MNESAFETVARCSKTLKLDFNAEEFAYMAQERGWSPETVEAVPFMLESAAVPP